MKVYILQMVFRINDPDETAIVVSVFRVFDTHKKAKAFAIENKLRLNLKWKTSSDIPYPPRRGERTDYFIEEFEVE